MAAISTQAHTPHTLNVLCRIVRKEYDSKHGYNILLDWRTFFYSFAGFSAKYSFLRMLAKKKHTKLNCVRVRRWLEYWPPICFFIAIFQINRSNIEFCVCMRMLVNSINDVQRNCKHTSKYRNKMKEEIKRKQTICVDDGSAQHTDLSTIRKYFYLLRESSLIEIKILRGRTPIAAIVYKFSLKFIIQTRNCCLRRSYYASSRRFWFIFNSSASNTRL